MKIDGLAPIEHGTLQWPSRKHQVHGKMRDPGMREPQDDLLSHRIRVVPRFVDRKPRAEQQSKERLRIGALSENEEIDVAGCARSPPHAEGQGPDDAVGSLRGGQCTMRHLDHDAVVVMNGIGLGHGSN